MDRPSSHSDQNWSQRFADIVRDVGADPKQLSGKLACQMMDTAVKLLGDGADEGELKLTSRSLRELRYALKVFRQYRHQRKISIFGSARTSEGHGDYETALALSRKMAQFGWMVITGAGGGIMRAGHGGAGRQASFGVAIRLPFETTANEFIEGDRKLIVFRYFFTRKLMFVSQAHAVALFPGGFGTQDEGFETLVLIQTGKAPLVPVVMVDAPGGTYWSNWDRFVREDLLKRGLIDRNDLNLYCITDDVDRATKEILQFYRNYHSQRFVGEDLVIRMQRPLVQAQINALNDRFSDLVADGKIQQCGALKAERQYPDMPRLR